MDILKAYLDHAVFGTLGIMGFIAVWVAIERYFYYRSVKWQEFDHSEHLNIALSRHLTALSIVGANAPYVGLLGTVLGILITFHDLGQGQNLDTGAIMLGLALALKATAAGIAIAIPSIMFYNGLVRKVDVINAQYRALQDQRNR